MINNFINIFLSPFNYLYLQLLNNNISFETILISLFIFDVLFFIIIKLLIDFYNYRRLL